MFIDDFSEAFLQRLAGSGRRHFGLVVGQVTPIADYVAFLAPTLPPQEDKVDVEEVDQLSDENTSEAEDSSHEPVSSSDDLPEEVDLQELSSSWVTHHSQQLARLLTGGCDILGVFVACPPDVFNLNLNKMKAFVALLEKQTKKRYSSLNFVSPAASSPANLPHSDRFILHACSSTKKISCKSVDAADAASAFKPVDLKFQDFLGSWSQVDCQFGLDCIIDVPASKLSKLSLMKQINQGLYPTLREIAESKIIVIPKESDDDGDEDDSEEDSKPATVIKMPAASTMLNPEAAEETQTSKAKKHARKGQGDAPLERPLPVGRQYEAQVFKKPLCDVTEPEVVECATQMVIRGTLCARAHAHAKATIQDSISYLKRDMVQSLLTRIELLCDDMLTEEDQETRPTGAVIYELPVRIFAPFKSRLTIADFVFRDESKADIVTRVKEVTGHVVAEDSLEVSVESFVPREVSEASSIESLSSHSGTDIGSLSEKDDGLLSTSMATLKRHSVSLLCAGGALAALFTAYLQLDNL